MIVCAVLFCTQTATGVQTCLITGLHDLRNEFPVKIIMWRDLMDLILESVSPNNAIIHPLRICQYQLRPSYKSELL